MLPSLLFRSSADFSGQESSHASLSDVQSYNHASVNGATQTSRWLLVSRVQETAILSSAAVVARGAVDPAAGRPGDVVTRRWLSYCGGGAAAAVSPEPPVPSLSRWQQYRSAHQHACCVYYAAVERFVEGGERLNARFDDHHCQASRLTMARRT